MNTRIFDAAFYMSSLTFMPLPREYNIDRSVVSGSLTLRRGSVVYGVTAEGDVNARRAIPGEWAWLLACVGEGERVRLVTGEMSAGSRPVVPGEKRDCLYLSRPWEPTSVYLCALPASPGVRDGVCDGVRSPRLVGDADLDLRTGDLDGE